MRIEGDIDAVVATDQLHGIPSAADLDARGVDAVPGQGLLNAPPVLGGVEMLVGHYQARVRQATHDPRPPRQQVGVDLRRVREAAEGDKTVLQAGQGADVGHAVRRRIRYEARRHADQAFGVSVVIARRRVHGIADQVVHGAKSGRARIAGPADLHGRGLAGETGEAVIGGVAGKVE